MASNGTRVQDPRQSDTPVKLTPPTISMEVSQVERGDGCRHDIPYEFFVWLNEDDQIIIGTEELSEDLDIFLILSPTQAVRLAGRLLRAAEKASSHLQEALRQQGGL